MNVDILRSFVTIAALIYGALTFIDSRISKAIEKPEFVNKLARAVRPYAIFDEKESIILDRGAMAFIENIEVQTDSENIPEKIIVKPKEYLEQAPILIPLDTDMSTIIESRGKKFDWIYSINYHGINYKEQRKYSIEIIRSA